MRRSRNASKARELWSSRRGWRARARDWIELLLPAVCAECGGEPGESALCERCRRALPSLPDDAPGPAPPPLHGWAAAVPFEDGWAAWIRRFKYPAPGITGLDPAADAVVLALALQAARSAPGGLPDAVIPVPQHRARLRARGFHPAGILAEAVAREHGLPVQRRALVRVRDTPSQTGLSRGERARNVAGAFSARPASLPRRIWLVDDVATTGHTLAAAARAARRAGARQVVGLCAAWTPGGGSDPPPDAGGGAR